MSKKIFEEAMLGKLKVKNRLIRSATWEGMAEDDGSIPEGLFHIYEELARGEVGTIITGFTSVSDEDQYFGGMMRLSNDKLIPQYRRLAQLVHRYDSIIIAQLALGGYYEEDKKYEIDELSLGQIDRIVDLFGDAARRAKESGFDGVQIHAAHFFFLSRFISPAGNHRKEDYGGKVENRSRILMEILQNIRKKAPELHVSMKINISDRIIGGLEPQESFWIVKRLEEAGIDSVEISANGSSVAGIKANLNEAYFFDWGKNLAEQVEIPVILVGGHRSAHNAEKVLNESRIEFLSLSRPLIREPDLPKRWKSGNKAPASCVSCNACYQTVGHHCIFVPISEK